MDNLRLVLPNEDLSDLVSLTSLGFRGDSLTDDQLRQKLLAEETNLLAHVRLTFEEYKARGYDGAAVVLDILKVCLDKRYEKAELTPLLKSSLPILLAFVILGTSSQRPQQVPTAALETVTRAAVALAIKEGAMRHKPSAAAPRADELVIVAMLTLASIANLLRAAGLAETEDATRFDLSFYLSLCLNSNIHEDIGASARYVLESACESLPRIRPVLREAIKSRVMTTASQLQGNKRLPLLASSSRHLTVQVLLGLMESSQSASPLQLNSIVALTELGTSAIRTQHQADARSGNSSHFLDNYMEEFCASLARWVSSSATMMASRLLTPQAAQQFVDLLRDIIYLATDSGSSSCQLDRLQLSKLLAECLLCLDEFRLMALAESSLCQIFKRLETVDNCLDAMTLIPAVSKLESVRGSLLCSILRASARSLLAEHQSSVVRSHAREQLLSATAAGFIDRMIVELRDISKDGVDDILADAMMDQRPENSERSLKKRCVGALVSLFGTELLMRNRLTFRNLAQIDLASTSDVIIDSGVWFYEALSEESGCLGGADFETWQNHILPNLAYCRSQTDDNIAKTLWAQIAYTLTASLFACLMLRPVQDDVTKYAAVVLEQISAVRDTQEALILATLLRQVLQSVDGKSLAAGTWQSLFGWAQTMLAEAERLKRVDVMSVAEALLTSICEAVADAEIKLLVSVIIQHQQKAPADKQLIYVELLHVVIAARCAAIEPVLLDKLGTLTLRQLEGCMTADAIDVQLTRAWMHVMEKIIEYNTANGRQLSCFTDLLRALRKWRVITPVALWKTRMKLWLQVLQHCRGSLTTDSNELLEYIATGPLFEAVLKTISQTATTRRRARTCIGAIIDLFGKVACTEEVAKFLLIGISIDESIVAQRAFLSAIEHALTINSAFTGTTRQQLEAVLQLAMPMCHNLDRKSTRSSRVSSRRSFRSARKLKLSGR